MKEKLFELFKSGGSLQYGAKNFPVSYSYDKNRPAIIYNVFFKCPKWFYDKTLEEFEQKNSIAQARVCPHCLGVI